MYKPAVLPSTAKVKSRNRYVKAAVTNGQRYVWIKFQNIYRIVAK